MTVRNCENTVKDNILSMTHAYICTYDTFHLVMHISIIKGIRHGSTNLQTHKFIEQIDYCYLFCVLNV